MLFEIYNLPCKVVGGWFIIWLGCCCCCCCCCCGWVVNENNEFDCGWVWFKLKTFEVFPWLVVVFAVPKPPNDVDCCCCCCWAAGWVVVDPNPPKPPKPVLAVVVVVVAAGWVAPNENAVLAGCAYLLIF